MTGTELTRMIKPRHLPAKPVTVEASEAERAALAARFGVTAIHALSAEVSFDRDGEAVIADGHLTAKIEQPCALTFEDFRYAIAEDLALRFVPAGSLTTPAEDEEIELDSGAPDEIEYEGDAFDLGEAVAQSLGLAIDPYREGPGADAVRISGLVSSEEASGPFGALAALKKD